MLFFDVFLLFLHKIVNGTTFVVYNTMKQYLLWIGIHFFLCTSFAQKQLSFAHQNIHQLPVQVQNNKNLTHLDISYTQLKELPTWLAQCPQLQSLNISGLSFDKPLEVAEIISKCPSLTHLIWNDAQLVYFPITLCKSKKLSNLQLNNNAIQVVPKAIKQLTQLKQLALSNNLIDSLPKEILALQQLYHLDFSFNPGIVTTYNYLVLKKMPQLTSLSLRGAIYLPDYLTHLVQLKQLDLAHGKFSQLPKNMQALNKIEHLNFEWNNRIPIHELIEQISTWKNLSDLTIGYPEMHRLPYNLNKFYNLKQLTIGYSCLEEIPPSFKQIPLHQLHIHHCTLRNLNQVLGNATAQANLKVLKLVNNVYVDKKWEVSLPSLDSLIVPNNDWMYWPFARTKVNFLDVSGNQINVNNLSEMSYQTVVGLASSGNLVYPKSFTKNHLALKDSLSTGVKRVIYANVGEVFDLPGNIRVNVPHNAFITQQHNLVKGDVVLHIQQLHESKDYFTTKLPTWDEHGNGMHLNQAIKIDAYDLDGKRVAIDQTRAIEITYYVPVKDNWRVLSFDYFHQKWVEGNFKTMACAIDEPEIAPDAFKAWVLRNMEVMEGVKKVNLDQANVYFKLKHNKRKNTLNFELTPDLGLGTILHPIVDQNKLYYPEWKVYKDIRWNYMQEDVEAAITKILQLEVKPQTDKIGKKGTFTVNTQELSNILLQPNPKADNYLLSFYLAKDTFSLEVLPYLSILKPKKIQKWHRVRYEKYTKKLAKRNEQWAVMDSAYFKALYRQQKKIQHNFLKNRDSLWHEKPVFATQAPAVFQYTALLHDHTWLTLGKNLVLKNPSTIEATFKIGKQVNHSKYGLAYHTQNKYFYWFDPKALSIPEADALMVYFLIGNKYLYQGVININNQEVPLTPVRTSSEPQNLPPNE